MTEAERVKLRILSAVVLGITVGAALAGCSAQGAQAPSASTTKAAALSVHGSITLDGSASTGVASYRSETDYTYQAGTPCSANSGYDDIKTGAEVDVVDGSGKVLAIGNLTDGAIASDGNSCAFGFDVADVPEVDGVYGVKVGGASRGVVHFTRAQLEAGPALTLGS